MVMGNESALPVIIKTYGGKKCKITHPGRDLGTSLGQAKALSVEKGETRFGLFVCWAVGVGNISLYRHVSSLSLIHI